MGLHPIVAEMLEYLQKRFPGQTELSLDDYAEYRMIGRKDASTDVRRRQIPYVKDGRRMFILMKDFAVYLARNKMVDGQPVIPTQEDIQKSMKRRRGFCQKP